MSEKLHGIQPSILKWAREAQGYSIDEIAERLRRSPSDIVDWESGASTPTYPQLEELAYKHYKRPLAIFFLPGPPKEPPIKKEFRTLPETDLETLHPDTRYQIRLGHFFQLSLAELNDGVNPVRKKIFRDLRLTVDDRVSEKAQAIRDYLGITLEVQTKWKTPEIALKAQRRMVEDAGVFVFKHSFKQEEISGFCLHDDEFPVIYLNNSTTKTRQVFSLFHELAHVLMGLNAICKVDFRYIERLPRPQKRIEQFCNAIASEILVPSSDFDRQLNGIKKIEEPLVVALAARYSVSREVVFRKMLDRQLISQAAYERKAKECAAQKEKGGKAGGNYYLTQAAYLGESYLKLVFGKHYAGKLTIEQVADYLGVKTGSVAGLDVLVTHKGGTG